ncbi:MAG: aldehyde dehydrogenase [Saprospiraceae bacterium]|nr:aldehyde dehydrogenase [Saprospiraceae bacterium]MBP6565573.1 aldehyde dehydrogenase [Saprospiraceae bacterium]
MFTISNYIGGNICNPISGHYLDNFEPATGKVYSLIPDSDHNDVAVAVEAAQKAFPYWSSLSIETRSVWLIKLADKIEEHLEHFAEAESKDNGKPITLARTMDIPRAVSNFKFFAHAITQFQSESHHMEGVGINYTLRQPIGVVGCISPWNLPLYLLTWKIAPALAAGNTVVAKPSEITPYTAFLLSKVCQEINFPAGVLNFVHGLGPKVGESICVHPSVKAISFTGGTSTGKRIASVAAPMFKKLSLELGGKNPNIIFADCDYEEMLATSVRSSFANQGQICLCGSRIFVERPLYEKFKTDFVARVSKLQVGDPMDNNTKTGAVVSEAHMNKVLSYIELAKAEGGTVITGGERANVPDRCAEGWFINPSVIEGLAYNCRTNQEEIFGPIVTIMPFDTEEEVLMYANSTDYGLAATLWTQNLSRAHRMAEKLASGIVWVNCWLVRDLRTPFGGVKNSGVGREGGMEALHFFTEAKNICISY